MRNIKATLLVAMAMAMVASAQTSAIQGSLLNVQGKPVPAEVTAYRLTVVHGNLEPHAACFTSVDKKGSFQCSSVEPGSYVLLFSLHQPLPSTTKAVVSPTQKPAPPVTSYAALAATPRVGHVPLVAFYPALSNWQLPNLLHVSAGNMQFVPVTVENDVTSTLEAAPAQGFATGQVQIFAVGEGFSITHNMQARVNPKDGIYLWEGLPAGQY